MRNNIRRMIEDLLETYDDDPVIDLLLSYAKKLRSNSEMSDDEIAEFVVDIYNEFA